MVVKLLMFVVFVNDLELMYFLYECFLENWIREVFLFEGMLIWVIVCKCK